jgi:hypothetical protein
VRRAPRHTGYLGIPRVRYLLVKESPKRERLIQKGHAAAETAFRAPTLLMCSPSVVIAKPSAIAQTRLTPLISCTHGADRWVTYASPRHASA